MSMYSLKVGKNKLNLKGVYVIEMDSEIYRLTM